MLPNKTQFTRRWLQRGAAVLCLVGLTAGVPWVENIPTPGFDGREPLTQRQIADKAFARGRNYYVDALEFEEKAKSAATDVRRKRYLSNAFDRYRASADIYGVAINRIVKDKSNPDYLPQLYLERANALFKIGEHPAAIATYEKAIDVAPAFLGPRFGRARAHLALNQLEAAKVDYAWVLREADTRSDAWVFVDALMVEFAAWPTADEGISAQKKIDFELWLATTRTELDETIRWTELEAQSP